MKTTHVIVIQKTGNEYPVTLLEKGEVMTLMYCHTKHEEVVIPTPMFEQDAHLVH